MTSLKWRRSSVRMEGADKKELFIVIHKAVLCMGRIGELSLHINANLYFHFGSRG